MSKDQKNNVISLLQNHAINTPDRAAFMWEENKSVSYEEFSQRIASLANHLKKLGIKKSDRVLIFVPLSLELYLTMFAVQQIGAISVFLDSWARVDQLAMCVNISSPKAMISFKKAFEFCKNVAEIENITIKLSTDKMRVDDATCPIEPVELTDTALITFTTGSSDTPKGANRTHGFLLAQHIALKKVLPYKGSEIDLPTFPIFALNNLASGVTTLIPKIDLSAPSEKDGQVLSEQIVSNQIDCITLSPSLFIKLSNFCNGQDLQLPSLKRVVTGGAPISRENVEHFKRLAPNAKILVLYGSTEVEPIAHIEADEMLACMEKGMGVNVGPIAEGLDCKLIKITKDPVAIDHSGWENWALNKDEVGELIVSGAHVCEGYYNDEQAFVKAKIKEPNGKIWHRTGDVGFFDDQGYFWFVGRVHNGVYRDGKLLFPLKPELLMKKLKNVKQAAFIGRPHPTLGEESVAVISLAQTTKETTSFIQEVTSLLKQNEIPVDKVEIIDTIPMDPRHHSKVEYNALRELLRK